MVLILIQTDDGSLLFLVDTTEARSIHPASASKARLVAAEAKDNYDQYGLLFLDEDLHQSDVSSFIPSNNVEKLVAGCSGVVVFSSGEL